MDFIHIFFQEAQWYLKTHITGVIVHGHKTMFFIDINEFPHDPNLTCTCLINALIDRSTDNCLPPTIYLQCDNCGRENKNKFLLGFLCYLCIKGYVREVSDLFLHVLAYLTKMVNIFFIRPQFYFRSYNVMAMSVCGHIGFHKLSFVMMDGSF